MKSTKRAARVTNKKMLLSLLVILSLAFLVWLLSSQVIVKLNQNRQTNNACHEGYAMGRLILITDSGVSRAEVEYFIKPINGTIVNQIKEFNRYEISVPAGREETDVGTLRGQPGLYSVYRATNSCPLQN